MDRKGIGTYILFMVIYFPIQYGVFNASTSDSLIITRTFLQSCVTPSTFTHVIIGLVGVNISYQSKSLWSLAPLQSRLAFYKRACQGPPHPPKNLFGCWNLEMRHSIFPQAESQIQSLEGILFFIQLWVGELKVYWRDVFLISFYKAALDLLCNIIFYF